jgi:hypothetical protein
MVPEFKFRGWYCCGLCFTGKCRQHLWKDYLK